MVKEITEEGKKMGITINEEKRKIIGFGKD